MARGPGRAPKKKSGRSLKQLAAAPLPTLRSLKLDVPFAELVRDARLLANLTARYHVLQELGEAIGAQPPSAVASFAADYTDAIEWVRGKAAMSRDAFDTLAAAEQARAFTVAGVTDEVVLGRIQDRVQAAVAQGLTLEAFAGQIAGILDAAGLDKLNPWHAETLFRTNVQDAYGAGRWQQFNAPGVKEHITGYEYIAVGDDRTRYSHAAMSGRRFPADSAVWQQWWPPNGFNCRCIVIAIFAIDKDQSMERGAADEKPDAGFSRNPAAGLEIAA